MNKLIIKRKHNHICSVQEGDSTMRNPSFPLRSPQSGCSPAGSEGTPKGRNIIKGKISYNFSVDST